MASIKRLYNNPSSQKLFTIQQIKWYCHSILSTSSKPSSQDILSSARILPLSSSAQQWRTTCRMTHSVLPKIVSLGNFIRCDMLIIILCAPTAALKSVSPLSKTSFTNTFGLIYTQIRISVCVVCSLPHSMLRSAEEHCSTCARKLTKWARLVCCCFKNRLKLANSQAGCVFAVFNVISLRFNVISFIIVLRTRKRCETSSDYIYI